ncbi:FGGY family carbohydrate kinase [Aestuariivirga sp.]|uniref:FGGY family carbohydrate kinase n=1 Tax=Aestuariivirga sp. TaxID=2650926 RepID=UPI0039E47B8D
MAGLDCGIDIGSTNLKVVLAGDDGRARATHTVPTPRVSDGVASASDAMALVRLLEDMIIASWRDAGQGVPLRSIAVAGIGEDGIGVTADLTPTGLAIPWFDKRAAEDAKALAASSDAVERTGMAITADTTAAKWAWIHAHRPHELGTAKWWIALTDFPSVWWTGQPFMSASLAARTGCFDLLQRHWADDFLQAVHAPPLPPLKGAGTVIGTVRGGPLRSSGAVSARTIVAAGGHDHPVAAAIIRRFDGLAIVDSLGTANLLYGEMACPPTLPREASLAFSLPPGGEEKVSCLGVLEFSAALDSAQQDRDGFMQFLAQKALPGAPALAPADLQGGDTRRLLERESLKARHAIIRMQSIGVRPGPVYTNGGWSRSPGFMQLRASVFGQPLHVIGDMEVTALGAAMFGADAATGHKASPLKAEDITMVHPVPEWAAQYDALYRQWASA